MSSITQKQVLLFITWITMAMVIAILVLWPIYSNYEYYDYWWVNSAYIMVFFVNTYLLFFLRHTFMAWRRTPKVILFFLMLPLIFYFVQTFNDFQYTLDYDELKPMMNASLSYTEKDELQDYTRAQFLFFAVASIITCVLVAFRLLVSIWRNHNRGTV